MSYRLDDPGTAPSSLAEPPEPPKAFPFCRFPSSARSAGKKLVKLDTTSGAVQRGASSQENFMRTVLKCCVSTALVCVLDRKSTRLNSSHQIISYAVFCLKKKKRNKSE